MKIGLPKEVKNNEFRVGLTPDSVGELSLNHKVFVQKNAGKAIAVSYTHLTLPTSDLV